jgi:hypothetical protein
LQERGIDAAGAGLTAAVEGPYGALALRCPRRYKAVILFAGGAGVAPMASLAAHLLSQEEEEGRAENAPVGDATATSAGRPCVSFVWAARDAAALREWAPGLLAALAAHPRCSARLFCTGDSGGAVPAEMTEIGTTGNAAHAEEIVDAEEEDAADAEAGGDAPPLPRVEAGRPDVEALVAAAGAGLAARDVAVCVCGPPQLVAAAHAAARRRRFHFHGEAFEI